MGKAAAEDAQGAAVLANQLKVSAGATKAQIAATEDWISAQGKAYGVADDKLRPALANLVRSSKDVGEAQKLASLAMDVSAATGKDLGAVSEALMKAQTGNIGALGRLGIATKDAEGKTLSFTEVTKEMADQFGGAASAKANTLQGRMQRLKLMFDETKESIGAKLLPIVERLATWFLNKGIPAISRFSTYLKSTFGPAISKVRETIAKAFGGSGGDVSKTFESIKTTVASYISIIKSLWDRFGSNILSTARGVFGGLLTATRGVFQMFSGIFKTFAALLKGDWSGVWEGIKTTLSGAWAIIKGLVSAGWAWIKGAFKNAGIAIKAVFSGIWNGLKSLAAAGMSNIVAAVRAVPGKISALAGMFRNAGKAVLNGLLNGLKGGAKFVSEISGSIWKSVKGMINQAIGKINAALPNSIGKGPFRVDLPDNPIPRMKTGGIVRGSPEGTLIVAGDGNHDEAIVPLSGPHAPPRGARANTAAGDQHVTVELKLDSRTIQRALLKLKREGGVELGLA